MGTESFLELMELDSSISRLVPSSDEEFHFLVSWENVDGVQSASELVGVNGSVVWDIEDIEGISQVEVVLLGKGDLGVLEFLLLVAEVFQTVDHFIFVIDSKNWLS